MKAMKKTSPRRLVVTTSGLILLTACLCAAYQRTSAAVDKKLNQAQNTITVTNLNDSGAGSLRRAIADAAPGDVINFDPALTSSGPKTITLTSDQLAVDKALTISGPGANLLTISGNNAHCVFILDGGSTLPPIQISGLTITEGKATSLYGGGGIIAFATTTITDCVIKNCTSSSAGGGIANLGTMTVTGSTIANNTSQDVGGGIVNEDSLFFFLSNLNLVNTTISGNAALSGGGVYCAGVVNHQITVTNCTITGNTAGLDGGGIIRGTGISVSLLNTVVAGNTAGNSGPDINGPFVSQGHNLIGKRDGGSGFTNGVNGDRVGTTPFPLDARLMPLLLNGGPTPTHALLSNSPAIDAGDGRVAGPPLNLTTDQCGRPRLADGNGDGTPIIDIGAFEARRLVVTNTNNSGAGSLRQAILDNQSNGGGNLIVFNLPASPQTITLTTSELTLDKPLIISGPGADRLTVGVNFNSRIFNVTASGSANIAGLTITGGRANRGGGINNSGLLALANCIVSSNLATQGGGVYNNGGAVTIINCAFTNNSATQGGGIYSNGSLTIGNSSLQNNVAEGGSQQGGGIFQQGQFPIEITGSTIADNTALGGGGGLYFIAKTGTLTNCTLSNNLATNGEGSAIENAGVGFDVGTLDLINCTIANNTASHSAILTTAGAATGAVTRIKNTLVAGNSGPNFVTRSSGFSSSAQLLSRGYNLDSDGTSGFTNGANGDLIGSSNAKIDARLGPLQNNGGPTVTRALLVGSPALDRGTSNGAPATDQRGFARAGTPDIGAYEAQFAAAPDITWTGQVNTDWNNPGNWLPAFVPLPTSNVLIDSNSSFPPSIMTSDVTVNTLVIEPGVVLAVTSPRTLTVTGNVTIGGVLIGNAAATFIFKGINFVNSGVVLISIFEFDTPFANLSGSGIFGDNFAQVVTGTTLTLQSDHQMSRLAIFNGATMNLNGHTLSLSRGGSALINVGNLMTDQSTVAFNGTVAQMIGGGAFDNLTINNPAGISLGADVTVSGELALTSGRLTTNQHAVILEDQASTTGTSYVIGNFMKHFSGPANFIFPVGTTNGYSPVIALVTAVSSPQFFTVKANEGPEPHITQTGRALQRYWTLAVSETAAPGAAQNGSASPNAPSNFITGTFGLRYLDTDVPATANENNFVIVKHDQAFSYPGGTINPTNNLASVTGFSLSSSANWTLAEPSAPTAVKLIDFTATGYDGGTFLQWQTGFEANNLGFNIYREQGGQRALANPQIVAGSALAAGSVAMSAGRTYSWWDGAASENQSAVYWLEDIDLNGKRTLHGPVRPQAVTGKPPATSRAALLSQISSDQGRTISDLLPLSAGQHTNRQADTLWQSAAEPAIKLTVRDAGWYRVSQPELLAAGLDPKLDPRRLQLYLEGVEQPMLVTGEFDGRFDPADAIEFYGYGQDSPETDSHVYWLAAGDQSGKRIQIAKSQNKGAGAKSLPHTLELKERSIYFSGLLNGDAENFFGRVINAQAVDETIPLNDIDPDARSAEIEIALQGVTDLPASPDHLVNVALNGVIIGRLAFDGREHQTETFSIYASLLKAGDNTVTLAAENGAADISLLDHIRITYRRLCRADHDALQVTASNANGPAQMIDGFTSPLIRVFDVTDPLAIQELAGTIVETKASGYQVTVDLSGNQRTLLALTDDRIKRPVAIMANSPSSLALPGNGANLIVLTRRDFMPSLEPLAALRRQQGFKVSLVDVEDVYDEFNYGEQSVAAIKAFLSYAATQWKIKPGYVLLAGEASYDPRNYLGLGEFDLVPTKLIDTQYMETASDDWLADFNGDGLADLRIGRLPMRTVAEADALVAKITAYEHSEPSTEMMLAADATDGFDFEAAATALQPLIPAGLQINQLERGHVDTATAKAQLLAAINRGQKVVNYIGHGNVTEWKADWLTNADMRAMVNRERLSLFVMMTCLNGYFHDPLVDSLGESLLKTESGGAVAVWASSAMTEPHGQAAMNREFYRLIFGPSTTLGDAAMRAKAVAQDPDIGRTWILLGDPTMRLR